MAPFRPGRWLLLSLLLLLSAGLRTGSFPASIDRLKCTKGFFTNRDNPEFPVKCRSCGNLTVLFKCNCTHDTVCGNATNTGSEALIVVVVVAAVAAALQSLLLGLAPFLWVVVAVAAVFYYRRNIGQAFMVGIRNCRNRFGMQTAPEVAAVNGHSNAEVNHNLQPRGNPDSADSVVLEVLLQNGHPNTPVPAQDTEEQDPEYTSVASSA